MDIQSPAQVMVPGNAVIENNVSNFVSILDAKGVSKEVPVMTGGTTATDVVIISGVNPGDKVVIP